MLEHALLVVAFRVAQRSVAAAYNPLVIVGPAGAGKSRLMAEVFAHTGDRVSHAHVGRDVAWP